MEESVGRVSGHRQARCRRRCDPADLRQLNADARTFARVTFPSLDRDAAGAPLDAERDPASPRRPDARRRLSRDRRAARLQRHVFVAQGARGPAVRALHGARRPAAERGLRDRLPRQLRRARPPGDLHDQVGRACGARREAQARRARRARVPRGAARHRARPHRARRLVAWRQRGAGGDQRARPRRRLHSATAPARRRIFARPSRSIRAAARRLRPPIASSPRCADAHPDRRARRLDAGEALRRSRRGDGGARRAAQGDGVSRRASRLRCARIGDRAPCGRAERRQSRERRARRSRTPRCARRPTPSCARSSTSICAGASPTEPLGTA